jgi:hypothetical protein
MNKARRTLGLALSLCGLLSGACSEQDSAPEPETTDGKGNGSGDERAAGQTGDEGVSSWTPPGGVTARSCLAWAEPAALDSLDSDTELGFSAADILGFVAGSHEAKVQWNAEPTTDYYALQVTPTGEDSLTVTIDHDGEAASYRGRVVPDGGTAPADCRGELALGLNVTLRSESGALDERWSGTLAADQVSEARVLLRAPVWRGRFPNQPDRDEAHFDNALEGSLDVIDADDPGSAFAWIDVVLRVRPDAVDGSVAGWVQNSEGGAFVVPNGGGSDQAGWIGVIDDGYHHNPWAVQ